jgi:crossover junction endodeoxyribonuclease RuvC
MDRVYFMGVDPGASGAICVLNRSGAVCLKMPLKNLTDVDIKEMLLQVTRAGYPVYGALERVHSMPKQGVASSFKFGASFGSLQAHLAWGGVAWEFVQPHKWQVDLKCQSRGDKNVTKAKAQQMFPDIRVTHAIADALLIAQWARLYGTWRIHRKEASHAV